MRTKKSISNVCVFVLMFDVHIHFETLERWRSLSLCISMYVTLFVDGKRKHCLGLMPDIMERLSTNEYKSILLTFDYVYHSQA